MLALVRNVALARAAYGLYERRRAVLRARRAARMVKIAAVAVAAGAGVVAYLAARRQRAPALRQNDMLPLPPVPISRKKVAREAKQAAAQRRDDLPPAIEAEVEVELNQIEDLSVPLGSLTDFSARKR